MGRITQIAKKFDGQSQASSVLLFFVVLTSIKFVLGIEHIQDVGLWDETMYLNWGVQLPQRGLPDPSWSPLYSVWYYLLSLIEPDRLRLYYLNYQVLVVSTVAAFYLFLRTLTINPYVSTCAAIWLLLSNVPFTWPFNGLFALLLLLVCLTLVVRVSSEETSYFIVGLGTAAAVVVSEEVDIRDVLFNVTRFYAHESCGQCTQCREGTTWMYKVAERILNGTGRSVDLDLLIETTTNMGMMPGMSICGLSDGAAWPIRTLVQKFRAEFESRIGEQEADAAERAIRTINPAAYELPILGR